jgi:hypothetical protein
VPLNSTERLGDVDLDTRVERRTLVTFHDDPDLGTHTFVNQLCLGGQQLKLLRGLRLLTERKKL